VTQDVVPDHFLGFERAVGPPGMPNLVLVPSLSGLDSASAKALHRLMSAVPLVSSTYGRGQVGEHHRFQRRMMRAIDVGACVVIGPDDQLIADPRAGTRDEGARVETTESVSRLGPSI
jgi:hypothetical protein